MKMEYERYSERYRNERECGYNFRGFRSHQEADDVAGTATRRTA